MSLAFINRHLTYSWSVGFHLSEQTSCSKTVTLSHWKGSFHTCCVSSVYIERWFVFPLTVIELKCGPKQPHWDQFGRGGFGVVPNELRSVLFTVWTWSHLKWTTVSMLQVWPKTLPVSTYILYSGMQQVTIGCEKVCVGGQLAVEWI